MSCGCFRSGAVFVSRPWCDHNCCHLQYCRHQPQSSQLSQKKRQLLQSQSQFVAIRSVMILATPTKIVAVCWEKFWACKLYQQRLKGCCFHQNLSIMVSLHKYDQNFALWQLWNALRINHSLLWLLQSQADSFDSKRFTLKTIGDVYTNLERKTATEQISAMDVPYRKNVLLEFKFHCFANGNFAKFKFFSSLYI